MRVLLAHAHPHAHSRRPDHVELHGVTLEAAAHTTTAIGSHGLLLLLSTNRMQHAIVHDLPGRAPVGHDRAQPDAGLGLAIVSSITPAHDATLTLTPRPTGGLCVTVCLPATPPPAALARPAGGAD